jgi:hypothetical protein
MDEERFNLSLRKLLKQFGVTAQREVEKAVDAAQRSGVLAGRSTLKARTVMTIEGLDAEIAVEGQIDLG